MDGGLPAVASGTWEATVELRRVVDFPRKRRWWPYSGTFCQYFAAEATSVATAARAARRRRHGAAVPWGPEAAMTELLFLQWRHLRPPERICLATLLLTLVVWLLLPAIPQVRRESPVFDLLRAHRAARG